MNSSVKRWIPVDRQSVRCRWRDDASFHPTDSSTMSGDHWPGRWLAECFRWTRSSLLRQDDASNEKQKEQRYRPLRYSLVVCLPFRSVWDVHRLTCHRTEYLQRQQTIISHSTRSPLTILWTEAENLPHMLDVGSQIKSFDTHMTRRGLQHSYNNNTAFPPPSSAWMILTDKNEGGGGLARSVVSQHRTHFALVEVQRQIRHCCELAEFLLRKVVHHSVLFLIDREGEIEGSGWLTYLGEMRDDHGWLVRATGAEVCLDPSTGDRCFVIPFFFRSNYRRESRWPVGVLEQVVPWLWHTELARVKTFHVDGQQQIDRRIHQHQQKTQANVQMIAEEVGVQVFEGRHAS